MDRKIQRAKSILAIESQAIKNIPIDENFPKAVQYVLACEGKVVCSGIGKAGIIAQKISATLSSTGTPSVFLHPGEAQHGDLGMLSPNDLLLVFSNSGKTRELIELIELSKALYSDSVKVITISGDSNAPLALQSHIVLSIGKIEEACSLGMAPTTSTTAMLALGDALCMVVMEEKKFTKTDFLKRHHGGYLGSQKS